MLTLLFNTSQPYILIPIQPIPTTFRKSFIPGKALLYRGLGHHRRNCDFHCANPMKNRNASFHSKFFDEVRLIEVQIIIFLKKSEGF